MAASLLSLTLDMAEPKPPASDEIKGIIERVDEICRESERIRDRANHTMRQTPFWPDRRKTPRFDDQQPPSSDKGNETP
jgi:hypothetical protein